MPQENNVVLQSSQTVGVVLQSTQARLAMQFPSLYNYIGCSKQLFSKWLVISSSQGY